MKPNYIMIKEQLEQMIETGNYKPGDRLPSEPEMAKKFGVSRETFRSAIKLLEQEGKLFVKHGVGTFVVRPLPQILHSLEKLHSITAMIKSAGLQEGEKRESIRTENSTREWADNLEIQTGTPVIVHERIRTANGEPVVYSINILPKQLVGNIFEEKEFSGSLFKFLEEECNLRMIRADTELVVPLHTDRNSQKLLIKPETTILLMKQKHYDHSNRPVLYSLDYLRNDVFKFWIRRTRE